MPPHLQTPRKAERPILWIIAGPNGSGKSSLYNRTDIEGWGGSVWIINPDLLTQSIVEEERLPLESANLAAVQRIERWLEASIEVYQTIGVETVLSSDKYRRLVERAHERGFKICMIYVLVRTVEINIERVGERVSNGGHNVPEEKIRSRRTRSFEQLAWFMDVVETLFLYDNSTREPDLLLTKSNGQPAKWYGKAPEDLREILVAKGTSVGRPIR